MKKVGLIVFGSIATVALMGNLIFADATNLRNLGKHFYVDSSSGILIEDADKSFYSNVEKRRVEVKQKWGKDKEERLATVAEKAKLEKEKILKDKKVLEINDMFVSDDENLSVSNEVYGESIISTVARNIQSELVKYSKEQRTSVPSLVHEIKVDGKQMYFEVYEVNGKKWVKNKTYTDTPVVKSNKNGNKFVFVHDRNIYEIDTKMNFKKITKDSYKRRNKQEFIEADAVFWAEAPQINANGNKLVYYSNKHIEDGKIKPQDSLWTYDFSSNEEKVIINNSDLKDGYFLSPYIMWLNDSKFLLESISNDASNYIYYIVDIETGTKKLILESSSQAHIENGYLVIRENDHINVFNVINEVNKTFEIPKDGKENMISISEQGLVAIPNGGKVAVLDSNTGKVQKYSLPENDNFMIIRWLNTNEVLLQIDNKTETSSWTIDIGGN
jgi:hypothetical protein